ncbi:MAG: cobalt-precorrin-6A reductase [Pseudomonadota bacterium]
MRILLLGGTREAGALADALAKRGCDAIYSYAGRTAAPPSQPIPTRIGGFGGIEGLRRYLMTQKITHVVDATHPFAAQMSWHCFEACGTLDLPLLRLERPAWAPGPADIWHRFTSLEDIVDALPPNPSRIFLAIGKEQIDLFASRSEHFYLLRFVDPPRGNLPLPHAHVTIARGPFDVAGDLALLQKWAITDVISKNSGGTGARAKLDAARALQLPVLMADRPSLPRTATAGTPYEVLRWLDHVADRGV